MACIVLITLTATPHRLDGLLRMAGGDGKEETEDEKTEDEQDLDRQDQLCFTSHISGFLA